MAEWKKVLLKGGNVTTEELKATDGTYVPANDSILFADDGDGSGIIKKETGAAFATALAGTNTATGLKAASGVIGLDKDTTAIGTVAGGDILLAYDITADVWGTVTANEVGSAGGNTDHTYALSATTDATANEATISLDAGGSGSGSDTIKLSGDADISLTQSGTPEDISIALDAGLTGVSSIYNTGLKVGRDSHNQIDFSTDNKITIKTNNANNDAVQLNTTAFQPVNDSQLELGLSGRRWKQGWFDKATVDNVVLDGSTIQHVDFGTDPSQLLTLNGTASVATKVDTTNVSDSADHHLLFVNADDSTNQGAETATALTYNPGTENLGSSSTNFLGTASTATAATSATTATTANKVKINDADETDDTFYFLFSDSHGGTSQDVYADNSFSWNPNSETLSVTNLKVSGTSTTVNTTDLIVSDKMIVVADGSAAVGDADGAGITVDVGSTEANMPELKWNNNSKLAGWTVSTYDASGATDYPVAIMTDGDGAPSGTAAGSGSFYVDTNAGNLDLYVYI